MSLDKYRKWSPAISYKFEDELLFVDDIDRNFDYGFDSFVVVIDKQTLKFYCAQDSGCSCPVPYEDHSFPHSFTEIATYKDFEHEFAAWRSQSERQQVRMDDRGRFESAVRSAYDDVEEEKKSHEK